MVIAIIRMVILFSIGKSTTRILKESAARLGVKNKRWYNMYNTTKCCRVVAAVGIERENVQCFFFHSCFKSCVVRESWCVLSQFNGVCFFFLSQTEKESSQVEFRQMPLSRGLKRRFTAALSVKKRGCAKNVHILHLPVFASSYYSCYWTN